MPADTCSPQTDRTGSPSPSILSTPAGRALFTAHHDFVLSAAGEGTDLELTITPSDVHRHAESALAGLEIGWEQLLDNLVALAVGSALTGTDSAGGAT